MPVFVYFISFYWKQFNLPLTSYLTRLILRPHKRTQRDKARAFGVGSGTFKCIHIIVFTNTVERGAGDERVTRDIRAVRIGVIVPDRDEIKQ